MRARIYQPARNPMQSGTAKTHEWILDTGSQAPKKRDPLMGWVGSKGAVSQIKMRFSTQEEAEHYAQKHGIEYDLISGKSRKRKPNIRKMGYAENFVPERRLPWTH